MQRVLAALIIVCNLNMAVAAEKSTSTKDEPKKEETKKTIQDETRLSYPELEVTPRASERLEIEAKNEARTHWATHLPIQVSALATIYAGMATKYAGGLTDTQQANYETSKKIAIGVGAGWLALTLALEGYYKPYFNGYKDVAKMPATNQREELTRERIAEEALYAPDSLAVKLKWFSFATNLAVNVALIQNDSGPSDFAVGIGALGAFAPLLFDSRWSAVADKHREYKKKIYGPIASSTFLVQQSTARGQQSYQPGLGLQWGF